MRDRQGTSVMNDDFLKSATLKGKQLNKAYKKVVNQGYIKSHDYDKLLELLEVVRGELMGLYNEEFGFLTKKEYNLEFPILFRKEGQERSLPCMFCGIEHIHSLGEGHRITHCATSGGTHRYRTLEVRGALFEMERGYYILDVE